jgi:hypothetical protein
MTFYRVCLQTLNSYWRISGLYGHSHRDLATNLRATFADYVEQ